MKKSNLQHNMVTLAIGLAVIAGILSFFDYTRSAQKNELANFAYEFANETDPVKKDQLKNQIEFALQDQSLARESDAAASGPLLDQLIACSYWANNALDLGSYDNWGWGYNDLLFYCFYEHPDWAWN